MLARLTSNHRKGVISYLAAVLLVAGTSYGQQPPTPERPSILFPAGTIQVYAPTPFTLEQSDSYILLRFKAGPTPPVPPGPAPPTPPPPTPPKPDRPDWLPDNPPTPPPPTPPQQPEKPKEPEHKVGAWEERQVLLNGVLAVARGRMVDGQFMIEVK